MVILTAVNASRSVPLLVGFTAHSCAKTDLGGWLGCFGACFDIVSSSFVRYLGYFSINWVACNACLSIDESNGIIEHDISHLFFLDIVSQVSPSISQLVWQLCCDHPDALGMIDLLLHVKILRQVV